MMRRIVLLGPIGSLLAFSTAPAEAQATSTAARVAQGTLTIFRPLSIANTANMSFGRLQPQGNGNPGTVILTSALPIQRIANGVSTLPGGAETPAIRTLSGEPGRIYRVTIPSSVTSSPNAYLVNTFTLWTQNRGDVTSTKLGRTSTCCSNSAMMNSTSCLTRRRDTWISSERR